MSILIEGMKMPKENDYTIAIVYGDGVVTEYHEDYWIRGADGEKQIGTAIPVPPHGRLIDADALLMRINHEGMEAYMDGVCYGVHPSLEYLDLLGEIIDDAPTIIPKEGET